MPIDTAEVWNFNGYLHHAVVHLKLNLFHIMTSQVLVFLLAILLQCVSKDNTASCFLMPFVFIIVTCCLRTHKFMMFVYVLDSDISLSRFPLYIILINILSIGYFIHVLLLLFQHGDTESDPGPKNMQANSLVTGMSIVYWLKICLRFCKLRHTIHSIVVILSAYEKPSLTEQFQKEIKVFTYMVTTYLGQTIQIILNKEVLASTTKILVKLLSLSQCVICEISLQNCKGCIGVVYRSPSQDSTEFENFLSDFDELLVKLLQPTPYLP